MENSANSTMIRLTIVALLLAGLSGCASRQIRTQMPVVPEKVAIKTKFLKLGMLGPYSMGLLPCRLIAHRNPRKN